VRNDFALGNMDKEHEENPTTFGLRRCWGVQRGLTTRTSVETGRINKWLDNQEDETGYQKATYLLKQQVKWVKEQWARTMGEYGQVTV
jgi:hypothetical protein